MSFQEDVRLPAKAQVALQSLSCTPRHDALAVGGQNDDIVFQFTQVGGERRASLDPVFTAPPTSATC